MFEYNMIIKYFQNSMFADITIVNSDNMVVASQADLKPNNLYECIQKYKTKYGVQYAIYQEHNGKLTECVNSYRVRL